MVQFPSQSMSVSTVNNKHGKADNVFPSPIGNFDNMILNFLCGSYECNKIQPIRAGQDVPASTQALSFAADIRNHASSAVAIAVDADGRRTLGQLRWVLATVIDGGLQPLSKHKARPAKAAQQIATNFLWPTSRTVFTVQLMHIHAPHRLLTDPWLGWGFVGLVIGLVSSYWCSLSFSQGSPEDLVVRQCLASRPVVKGFCTM